MAGTLYGVGVGPGDPELMTLKAARVLAQAPVAAYFAKRGDRGNARTIADTYLHADAIELALYYPFTIEISADAHAYRSPMASFYDESAELLARHLKHGRDVALLCEGDPLFYGSYIHIHERLASRYNTVIIPGVTSVAGCAAVAGLPLISSDGVFSVIPATLCEALLEQRLAGADAAAIVKLGRNFAKVKRVLDRLGVLHLAFYVERGTTSRQAVMPLGAKQDEDVPYFSLILVPGHKKQMCVAAE